MNRMGYIVRYWWRRAVLAVGWCPRCWSRVNYARGGRAICPYCGR
jgi:hypothetical protein